MTIPVCSGDIDRDHIAQHLYLPNFAALATGRAALPISRDCGSPPNPMGTRGASLRYFHGLPRPPRDGSRSGDWTQSAGQVCAHCNLVSPKIGQIFALYFATLSLVRQLYNNLIPPCNPDRSPGLLLMKTVLLVAALLRRPDLSSAAQSTPTRRLGPRASL